MTTILQFTVVDKFPAKKILKCNGNKGMDDDIIILFPARDIDLSRIGEWVFEIVRPEEIGNRKCTFTAWAINPCYSIGLFVDTDTSQFIHLNDEIILKL